MMISEVIRSGVMSLLGWSNIHEPGMPGLVVGVAPERWPDLRLGNLYILGGQDHHELPLITLELMREVEMRIPDEEWDGYQTHLLHVVLEHELKDKLADPRESEEPDVLSRSSRMSCSASADQRGAAFIRSTVAYIRIGCSDE